MHLLLMFDVLLNHIFVMVNKIYLLQMMVYLFFLIHVYVFFLHFHAPHLDRILYIYHTLRGLTTVFPAPGKESAQAEGLILTVWRLCATMSSNVHNHGKSIVKALHDW